MTRIGLVGYGFAGQDIHAPAILEAGLEVAAVATGSPERAALARARHPDARIDADLSAMLAAGGVDVIVLASPSGVHLAQGGEVSRAGVPLVVDKPLAVCATDALSLVDLAAHHAVPVTVFQNRRYDAEWATAQSVVASGDLGEIFRLEYRWERWRPVPKGRWREQLAPEAGGGIMLDLHSHVVDGAVRMLGPVTSVYAAVASRTTLAEDDTHLTCGHEGGALSILTASSLVAAPGPRLRILGTRAAYVLAAVGGEPHIGADLADIDRDHHGWVYAGEERSAVPRVASSQADFYRDLAEALRAEDAQRAMPVDPHDAVHTLAVIDAARVSSDENRVVEVITPGQRPA